MSNAATIPARMTGLRLSHDQLDALEARIEDANVDADSPVIDLVTPRPSVDISCWRLLTARVPLTLLLDLALPSAEELAELYDELMAEQGPMDWVPAPRAARER